MSEPIDTSSEDGSSSTRPYLVRALYEWCTDNGLTPYIAVIVDGTTQVPTEYVKNDEIVLNISFSATSGLSLGNDVISFRARFGGHSREVIVPIDHVIAIYARETGQGMAFPTPSQAATPRPVLGAVTGPPRLKPVPSVKAVDDQAHSDEPEKDAPDPDGPPEPTGGGAGGAGGTRRATLKRIK